MELPSISSHGAVRFPFPTPLLDVFFQCCFPLREWEWEWKLQERNEREEGVRRRSITFS